LIYSFLFSQVTFDKFQADEQGWVDTIKSVKVGGIVRMNTMDWLGQSQYAAQTVYWSSLSSAISEVLTLWIQHVSFLAKIHAYMF
jgi:phospholipase D3/4